MHNTALCRGCRIEGGNAKEGVTATTLNCVGKLLSHSKPPKSGLNFELYNTSVQNLW